MTAAFSITEYIFSQIVLASRVFFKLINRNASWATAGSFSLFLSLVCRLPDGSLYIHEASHPGRVWSRKKVSGFRGLEHVNAIKPIILKPIEWRIMVSCRYNASMKPHLRASFRSLGYFLILLPSASVVFLVSSFCGAREGTREGKRRRVLFSKFLPSP